MTTDSQHWLQPDHAETTPFRHSTKRLLFKWSTQCDELIKMRLTGSRAYTRPILVPKMPLGLVELMEGLTKDVLKNNPTNVYEFCAKHMQKLLEIRDGESIKKSLTLEEKICYAQEKVRQRAEHRWQKYVMQSDMNTKNSLPPDYISSENFNTSSVHPLLQNNLKAPMHHDKELAADSEVEISGELFEKMETVVKNSPNVDKNIDTNVNVKKGGEDTAPTHEICDVKSESAIQREKEINDPELIFIGENDSSLNNENENNEPDSRIKNENRGKTLDGELENEDETNSALNNENQKDEGNSGLGNENEEINNGFDNMNQNDATNGGLEKDNQSKETIIALRNEDNFEEITNTHNKNQSKDTDGALGNENQNEKLNIAIENEKQNVEVDQILQDETLKKDDTLNENTSSNSVDSAINIASFKPQHGEGNDENNQQKFEEPEQRLMPQNYQTTEIFSEKSANESNKNNFQEFSKVEIKIYSAENTVQDFQVEVEQNDQSGVDDNTTTTEFNNVTIPSENHEEISASSSQRDHREMIIYDENTSPKKNYTTNVEDNKNQPNMNLNVKQSLDSESGASSIFNENNQNDETDCDKSNEKSLGKSVIVQDKSFNEDTMLEKNDKFESYDMANESLLEKKCSKTDGNLVVEVVEESAPARDLTLVKRSVSVDGANVDRDDSTGLQSHEATQDVVNDHGNMNLETAAITIQKVFRNFLFKSRAESTLDDTTNDDANVSDEDSDNKALIAESEFSLTSLNKERRGLGITRMDTVLQTVNEEKSLSLSTDDSSTLSSAATIIQSHVRGFLVRNKLNSYRTVSSNSLVISNPSVEADTDHHKNKTVLNIHIVPEGSNLSRDESIITSMDLSLDSSPPSSINLHPLGYDKSERRKQLKREDAIQSISPPTNNSGKLSEDSVKDAIINEITAQLTADGNSITQTEPQGGTDIESAETSTDSTRVVSVINAHDYTEESSNTPNYDSVLDSKSLTKMSSDEMDVVTAFVPMEDKTFSIDIEKTSKLVHSGEFHDMVLPTKVSRSDTSVVREFKNVLVYFLLWNHS